MQKLVSLIVAKAREIQLNQAKTHREQLQLLEKSKNERKNLFNETWDLVKQLQQLHVTSGYLKLDSNLIDYTIKVSSTTELFKTPLELHIRLDKDSKPYLKIFSYRGTGLNTDLDIYNLEALEEFLIGFFTPYALVPKENAL